MRADQVAKEIDGSLRETTAVYLWDALIDFVMAISLTTEQSPSELWKLLDGTLGEADKQYRREIERTKEIEEHAARGGKRHERH